MTRQLFLSLFIVLIALPGGCGKKEVRESEREHSVILPGRSLINPNAVRPVVITVKPDGSYIVGGIKRGLDQVRQLLNEAVKKNPDQKVLVRPDKETKYLYVASIQSICKSLGVKVAVKTLR